MSLVRSTRVLLCSLTENFRSSASPAKHLVHAALSTWNLWFTAAPYPAERKYLDCSRGLQRQSRVDGGVWGKCSCANGSSIWSRERAQQKVARLFLWTIHPPGQTLEKPMASHQPPIITGPLIKVHHF